MFSATLYIMACSAKNRMRRRLQRLREPRYLLGALVGSAYLYISIFGRMRATRSPRGRVGRVVPAAAFLPAFGGFGPVLAGLLLLCAGAASLLMPFGSGLLDFSKAETEFLFAAPVSRRQLLFYRLMRSQWAVVFSALIVSLTYPLASPSARLRGFIGAWLGLMTAHVFFTGVSLTRTRIVTPTLRARLFAWGPRVLLVTAVAIVAAVVGQAMAREPVNTAAETVRLFTAITSHGLPSVVVWPFTAVVRPLFAASFLEFASALPAALLMYALMIGWVLGANEAFDVLTETRLAQNAVRPASKTAAYRARPMPWRLALGGRQEIPFAWKAAAQTFRVVDRRVLIRMGLVLVWLTLAVALVGRARGLAQVIGLFAACAAVFAVIVGPQIFRLDLRQDLAHLELLKTWPLRPAAVVRGEMLWPAFVVTVVAWLLGAVALFLSATVFSHTGLAWRLAAGLGAMILAPGLVFVQYTIHNAAALLFPAWVVTGSGRPRGVDAMGQRLIMLGGTWLVLLLAILPGAVVGVVLWVAFFRFVGPWVLIPIALAGTAIVLTEVLAATELLGPAYERVDITSVERNDA
jgi:hypothetical protein